MQLEYTLFALLLACSCTHSYAIQPQPPGDPAEPALVATMTIHGHDSLEISYRIPATCEALVFANAGMPMDAVIQMRSDWKAADDCTDLDFQSVRPRHPACRVLRLHVPATSRARDGRMYANVPPWAQPFGDGLYAHTAAYTVDDKCGPTEWHFAAPGGTVVVDGKIGSERMRFKAPDAATNAGGVPVLLLAQPYGHDMLPLYAESRIDEATRSMLARTLEQARDALGTMLPAHPLERGYMLVASSASPSLNSGKLSPHVLFLQVPAAPTPDLEQQARILIPHETAHLAQAVRWNEAWSEDVRAIREGGAEFLRLAASVRIGWLSEDRYKDELEAAVNSCLISAAGKAWSAFDQRNAGLTADRCGLTLHLLGMARKNDRLQALQRLQAYYREARTGVPMNFARAIECGGATDCVARRLPRLLGKEPLAKILHDEAREPDSLLHAQAGWGPALVEVMVYRHLEQLLLEDCRPGATISHDKRAPRIGPGARCESLRSGMAFKSAEGMPLFAGVSAIRSSARACRRLGVTVLGLANGERIKVPCGPSVALPAQVWAVDAVKAMQMATGSP